MEHLERNKSCDSNKPKCCCLASFTPELSAVLRSGLPLSHYGLTSITRISGVITPLVPVFSIMPSDLGDKREMDFLLPPMTSSVQYTPHPQQQPKAVALFPLNVLTHNRYSIVHNNSPYLLSPLYLPNSVLNTLHSLFVLI